MIVGRSVIGGSSRRISVVWYCGWRLPAVWPMTTCFKSPHYLYRKLDGWWEWSKRHNSTMSFKAIESSPPLLHASNLNSCSNIQRFCTFLFPDVLSNRALLNCDEIHCSAMPLFSIPSTACTIVDLCYCHTFATRGSDHVNLSSFTTWESSTRELFECRAAGQHQSVSLSVDFSMSSVVQQMNLIWHQDVRFSNCKVVNLTKSSNNNRFAICSAVGKELVSVTANRVGQVCNLFVWHWLHFCTAVNFKLVTLCFPIKSCLPNIILWPSFRFNNATAPIYLVEE